MEPELRQYDHHLADNLVDEASELLDTALGKIRAAYALYMADRTSPQRSLKKAGIAEQAYHAVNDADLILGGTALTLMLSPAELASLQRPSLESAIAAGKALPCREASAELIASLWPVDGMTTDERTEQIADVLRS